MQTPSMHFIQPLIDIIIQPWLGWSGWRRRSGSLSPFDRHKDLDFDFARKHAVYLHDMMEARVCCSFATWSHISNVRTRRLGLVRAHGGSFYLCIGFLYKQTQHGRHTAVPCLVQCFAFETLYILWFFTAPECAVNALRTYVVHVCTCARQTRVTVVYEPLYYNNGLTAYLMMVDDRSWPFDTTDSSPVGGLAFGFRFDTKRHCGLMGQMHARGASTKFEVERMC